MISQQLAYEEPRRCVSTRRVRRTKVNWPCATLEFPAAVLQMSTRFSTLPEPDGCCGKLPESTTTTRSWPMASLPSMALSMQFCSLPIICHSVMGYKQLPQQERELTSNVRELY
jgi:hypothetical protein